MKVAYLDADGTLLRYCDARDKPPATYSSVWEEPPDPQPVARQKRQGDEWVDISPPQMEMYGSGDIVKAFTDNELMELMASDDSDIRLWLFKLQTQGRTLVASDDPEFTAGLDMLELKGKAPPRLVAMKGKTRPRRPI